MLALASAQNTDPLLAISSVVKPANELLITPAEAVATVLPNITPVEEVSTVLVIAPAEEAATKLAVPHTGSRGGGCYFACRRYCPCHSH